MRLPAAGLLLAAVLGAVGGRDASAQQRLEPPNPLEPKAGNPYVREGDSHYARRQERRVAAVADKAEIAAAARAYETASEAADSAEARWKLARALVFQGSYTDIEPAARQACYEKARRVAEDAVRIVERRAKRAGAKDFEFLPAGEIAAFAKKDTDAAPTFYWAAVAWGVWALERGKEEATRLGAAQKIRDYATILIAIDPAFEESGGHRILGRVHDQAPRMQGETEWVSRQEAVRHLRLAVQADAQSFANRLYLAEALARGGPSERAEAVRIAEALAADAPSPSRIVEDLRTQKDAADDLRGWK